MGDWRELHTKIVFENRNFVKLSHNKTNTLHEIEMIMDHRDEPPHRCSKTGRMIRNRRYLIKWKKYPSDMNSWEPYENIKLDAPDSVHLYEEGMKHDRVIKKRKHFEDKNAENLMKRQKEEEEKLELQKKQVEAQKSEEETSAQKVAPLKLTLKLQGNKLNPKIMENIEGTAKITSPRISTINPVHNPVERQDLNESTTSSSDSTNSGNSEDGMDVTTTLNLNTNNLPSNLSIPTNSQPDGTASPLISPKVKTTINLNKFRNKNSTRFQETRLVHEITALHDFRIFKIEPPNGQAPDQLIYLLMNPKNRTEYWRISSQNLQKTPAGQNMMCKWLERLIHPFMKKEIEAMKKMDRSLLHRIPMMPANDSDVVSES